MMGKSESNELPAMKINDILKGIGDKIEKNPLLREVHNRKNGSFEDLIEKYGGDKVMMAVQLVESYNILLEMNRNCGD